MVSKLSYNILQVTGSVSNIIQGMSSLRSITPFTPTCNTGLTKN